MYGYQDPPLNPILVHALGAVLEYHAPRNFLLDPNPIEVWVELGKLNARLLIEVIRSHTPAHSS